MNADTERRPDQQDAEAKVSVALQVVEILHNHDEADGKADVVYYAALAVLAKYFEPFK